MSSAARGVASSFIARLISRRLSALASRDTAVSYKLWPEQFFSSSSSAAPRSANTLAFLKDYFMTKGAASITIVTLLDKPSRRTKAITADLAGFVVPDEFVVGYGLDYCQQYRNVPYIGVLKPEVYSGE